jgi:hypothetical protein
MQELDCRIKQLSRLFDPKKKTAVIDFCQQTEMAPSV